MIDFVWRLLWSFAKREDNVYGKKSVLCEIYIVVI